MGGLPPTVNEQQIASFFSHALAAVGGNTAGPGESVVNVYINREKNFAFLEFRTGAGHAVERMLVARNCGGRRELTRQRDREGAEWKMAEIVTSLLTTHPYRKVANRTATPACDERRAAGKAFIASATVVWLFGCKPQASALLAALLACNAKSLACSERLDSRRVWPCARV